MSTTTHHELKAPTLSIAEVADRFGISTDTLRYYEKAGLIAAVGRSSGNHRRYATADLAWIEFLLRLRDTGMPIAGMQHFAALRAQGDATMGQRLALLRDHRTALEQHIERLRRHAETLDAKITHYQDVLAAAQEQR